MAQAARMRFARWFLMVAVSSAPVLGAEEFWEQMTPEERRAAGYDQLSPGQRAAIESLAVRFAEKRARPAVAMALVKAREEGRAEAQSANLEKKRANIGLPPREDDETEVIHTRIIGEFRGWSGRTLFKLANEQVWVQDNSESRFFPLMVDPEVEIRPSRMGGWKMTLLKEGLWIRVKRLR